MTFDKKLDFTNLAGEENSEFAKLLGEYDYSFNKGDIVKGSAVSFESGKVLVDIGAKASAILPNKEISNTPIKSMDDYIKIGEEKEFIIIREENDDAQLTISLKKVIAAYTWQKLEEVKENNEAVEAEVISSVKGGILVDVMGLRGFVPSSHIRARNIEDLVGTKVELKILSLDPTQNNLIMSHRKVLSEQQAEQRKDLFDKIEIGSVVEGDIVRLADFGAFIDIGGIDGLLPLSQMSWRWVDHPADILEVGQKIKVEIIGIDHDKQRVSLSLKSQQPDPWAEAAEKIKEGEKIKGTVTRIKHFGAFVEVFPGVEALLPQKEIQDYQNATKNVLEVNSEIESTVVRFNPEDRRISLSLSSDITEEEQE